MSRCLCWKRRGTEQLRIMSPQARETYEKIRELRDATGALEFDICNELRKLRGEGENEHTLNPVP